MDRTGLYSKKSLCVKGDKKTLREVLLGMHVPIYTLFKSAIAEMIFVS